MMTSSELVAADVARLDELERVIEAGCRAFIETGAALVEICERELYKVGVTQWVTFEAYCRDRWQMSPQHAYRLIQAYGVVEILRPTGRIPGNERQARELVGLEPGVMRLVWLQALGEAEDGQPTAEDVRALADEARASMTPEQLVELMRKEEEEAAKPGKPAQPKPVNGLRRLTGGEKLLARLDEWFPKARDIVRDFEQRRRDALQFLEDVERAARAG